MDMAMEKKAGQVKGFEERKCKKKGVGWEVCTHSLPITTQPGGLSMFILSFYNVCNFLLQYTKKSL